MLSLQVLRHLRFLRFNREASVRSLKPNEKVVTHKTSLILTSEVVTLTNKTVIEVNKHVISTDTIWVLEATKLGFQETRMEI
jgi:hypothetical protein